MVNSIEIASDMIIYASFYAWMCKSTDIPAWFFFFPALSIMHNLRPSPSLILLKQCLGKGNNHPDGLHGPSGTWTGTHRGCWHHRRKLVYCTVQPVLRFLCFFKTQYDTFIVKYTREFPNSKSGRMRRLGRKWIFTCSGINKVPTALYGTIELSLNSFPWQRTSWSHHWCK